MASSRSCSRLVLGKLSDGLISTWMRWRKMKEIVSVVLYI